MFTGITQELAKVKNVTPNGDSLQLEIISTLPAEKFKKGESIAVNGVCLTVESYDGTAFFVTAVPETLHKSNLGKLKPGDKVNLEAPLTLSQSVSGHLVLGHVDGLARVTKSGADFQIQVPAELIKYMAKKGSLTVNGVSLTIADQIDESIRIALIPETLRATNLGLVKEGDFVNIEVDLIARYLEKLMK